MNPVCRYPTSRHRTAAVGILQTAGRLCYFVDMEPRAYSVDETAAALGISRATVYNLFKEGKLFYATVGKRKRVPVEAIDAMLRGEIYNPNAGPVETHQDGSFPPTPSLLA